MSPAAAFPRSPAAVRANLSMGAWRYYEWLWHLRRSYRKVVPSVAYAAKALAVSCSTIRRWRAELRAAGLTLGVYNGGQGRRCVEYVGERAVERALADSPAWPEKSRFGGLRMGRERARKDLKNEILKPSASLRSERGTPSESPPSEIVRPDTPVADRDAPPDGIEPRPPAGGSMPTDAPMVAHAEVVHGWTPAIPVDVLGQHRPPPAPPHSLAPQSPASGRQLPTGEQTASRRDVARPTASIAKKRPDLFRLVFKLWRAYGSHLRGGLPPDHPTDVGAVKAILAQALVRYRRDEDRAVDDIAWGMREFLADRDPTRRFKTLANLRRYREEYGRAPDTFRAPARVEHATITPHKPTEAAVAKLIRATADGGAAQKDSPRRAASPVGSRGSPAASEKPAFVSPPVSNNRDTSRGTPAAREIAQWRNVVEFLRSQKNPNSKTLAEIERAEAKIAAILSGNSGKVVPASSSGEEEK